jgi:hypothetical protein
MCSRALMNRTFFRASRLKNSRVVAAVTGNTRELVRDDNGEFTSVHATQHLLVARPVGVLARHVEIAEDLDVVSLETLTKGGFV